MTSAAGSRIEDPEALVSWHRKWFGESGRAWIDALPDLAAGLLDGWQLRPDGPATCGAVALVLPVLRADDTPAVLKLQPDFGGQGVGEPEALRAWNGNGAVRLLDHDAESGSVLLERLDANRTLSTVSDDLAALEILSALLARLSAVPAPAGVHRLSDFAADLLDRVPRALTLVRDPSQHRLMQDCTPRSRMCSQMPATACCTRICTTSISWHRTRPTRESPGWPSTPTRWPAIPVSCSSRHCTTGGRKLSPPAASRGPSGAAST